MALDAGEGLALVNRGWLAATRPAGMPPVPRSMAVELTGTSFCRPGAPICWQNNAGARWPKLLQAVEMEK